MIPLGIWLATALTATAPVRVAAPGFSVLGLDQKAGDFYSDQVAQQLSFHGLKVVTRSEIQALIGHEREKQLLGCDDGTSCAAELAGALGSDALLVGEVAKVGDKFRLSVRIIRAGSGERVSSAVVTGSSEDGLLDAITAVAPRLASETIARVRGEKLPEAAVGVSAEHIGTKRLFWIPATIGAVALGGGAFAYTQSKSRYDTLRSAQSLEEPTPSRLRNEGQSWQTASMVSFGVGAAGLAAAAGLLLFGSESVVEAGVSLAPGGVSFGIAGAF